MTSDSLLLVDVQDALEHDLAGDDNSCDDKPPSEEQLGQWAQLAHKGALDASAKDRQCEVTLRLVDEFEMTELNQTFRGKSGSTNVLSFPVDSEFDLALDDGPTLLGDIVICHNVIVREALEQGKTITNHYAHMVTHGVLHLHGYDHLDDESAHEMEALEVIILSNSRIENPYN